MKLKLKLKPLLKRIHNFYRGKSIANLSTFGCSSLNPFKPIRIFLY